MVHGKFWRMWSLLLAAMWAVALYGFVSKVFFAHRVEAVSLWTYVLLGWMPVIAAPSLVAVAPAASARRSVPVWRSTRIAPAPPPKG